MRSQRHQKKHSEGNKERWLITYADLITVLLIFFIVMYSLSQVDVDKFKALTQSLAAAFGASGSILESPGPSAVEGMAMNTNPQQTNTNPQQTESIQQQLESIQQQLEEIKSIEQIWIELDAFIEAERLRDRVTASLEERGVVLSFQEEVFFSLGSAELTPEARSLINKVAVVFRESPYYTRVEGHTDDWPINTPRFPSNWELSAARATSVVQELVRGSDFPPHRLSAIAYGEYRPRVPNNTAANRQLNRRVDFVILRSDYTAMESHTPFPIELEERPVSYIH